MEVSLNMYCGKSAMLVLILSQEEAYSTGTNSKKGKWGNFWVVPLFRPLGMWFTLALEGGEYIN